MFDLDRDDATLAKRVAHLWCRLKTRIQLRHELEGTSDRALAELGLRRGDIADVVAGTYRRAA